MGKHKRKSGFQGRRPSAPRPSKVRLSQCMIVKNEEKNIEKALSWAKGIAFEQIVVDTGSTDKTVEIAERMGAKVYHFEWINDFSAAKNFALEQAKGDWIAFLDADEYLNDADVPKILPSLAAPSIGGRYDAIMCAMLQISDNGRPISTIDHIRFYRNLPSIRYQGRIHESLPLGNDRITRLSDVTIIHTGYSESAYTEKGKSDRNITMLRAEFERDPDDPNTMMYLGDSLLIKPNEQQLKEAEELYIRALASDRPRIQLLEIRTLGYMLRLLSEVPDRTDEMLHYCEIGLERFPWQLDFPYYYALYLNKTGEAEKAWEQLKKCEDMLSKADSPHVSVYIVANPMLLFYQMARTALELDDRTSCAKYCTLVLKEDKYQKGILTPYIRLLSSETPSDEIVSLLKRIYNLNNVKEKIFLLRAAKEAGNLELCQKILALITPEERAWMSGGEAGSAGANQA